MNNTISEIRSKNYVKQIKGSFIFKGLTIFASFLSIPLMIKYLGVENYGVWSTLLSIVSWIVLFDIGIGNGLRNKISESLAKDNTQEAHKYISTAYTIIGAISVILILIFLLASEYIPWHKVFNITSITSQELQNAVNTTVIFLFLNFWLSLINQIFNGLQKTSLVVFNQFLSNTFSLFTVFILYTFYESSLVKLAFAYGISLLSSSLILSLWFYSKNKNYIPKIKSFNSKNMKAITSLGFQFFIIQIAVIIIFTTDKILITQLFGPELVASYDVVFKLFSIITIAFSLINTPLLSAYNDAYHRNDLHWMRNIIKRQLKFYLLIVLSALLLGFFAKNIIYYWIGNKILIANNLIIMMTLYIFVVSWNSIYGTVLGGLGYIRLGAFYTVLTGLANIPLSYYFAIVLDFGVSGIILGTISSIAISSILSPLQVYYFIFTDFKSEKFTRILR